MSFERHKSMPVDTGTILQFKKGKYVDRNKQIFDTAGIEFIPIEIKHYWIRWPDEPDANGKKRPEIRERDPDKYFDEDREAQGYLDQALWRTYKGKKEDPVKARDEVRMLRKGTLELYTFVTESWGGRKTVTELIDAVIFARTLEPTACMVARLESESVRFKDKDGESIEFEKPKFAPQSWTTDPRRGNPRMLQIENGPPAAPTLAAPRSSLAEELDDEIGM